jgi:hypothetical protein
MKDSIVIYSTSKELASDVRDRIAPSGSVHLQTKYYTVSVPVSITASLDSCLGEDIKGILVVEDPTTDSRSLLRALSGQEEDRIRIFLSHDETLLGACIDHGFELVTYAVADTDLSHTETGLGRVIEALKCRMWEADEPSTSSATPDVSNPDTILDSFESLISQMQQVRQLSSSLSDTERRSKAESIASQLAKLLCDDSEDDITVT